jgi:hypothetical protein
MALSKILSATLSTLSILIFGGIIYAGNTGILNDPKIYYAGKDLITGKPTVVQGCKPERLKTDGSCDRSFKLDEFLDGN